MTLGKAALFVEPYRFELTELPPPPIGPDEILVKITSAGICGSDLHYWRGEMKPMVSGEPGPVILGHEMTGVVHTLGQGIASDSMGRPLKEGDRVAYPYFFPCRRCYICLRGELNHCPNRFRFRASVNDYPYCDGGYSEYYRLRPGHFVFKVPDELPDEAVTAVNCAVSQVIYGLRRAEVALGDSVVVQGAGGLGVNATAAAKEMGASPVIVIDGLPQRLEMAGKCGADYTVDINEFTTPESRVERVKELTDGWGADVAIEVVGFPQVVPEGLEMLRKGGTYVEVGNIGGGSNVTLDISKILWGMTRIIPTAHYDPYILPVALDFLVRTADKYPLTRLMSHTFPLEQIMEAFRQSEWAGKDGNTAVTRSLLTP
jgi:threonine dehydrogenase-like Zn-dependent dehydrogenase